MKLELILVTAFSVALAASPLSWSADAPGSNLAPPKPRVAAPQASHPEGPGMFGGAKMQEQMKQMQAQMEVIRQIKDPVEKERLMNEHLAAMQDHMKMMQGMSGTRPPMGPGPNGAVMPAHIIDQRFRVLEQRMDTLQQLMEQLIAGQKK